VPQDFKNQMLKQLMNHQMIGLILKPRDVYSWKKKTSQHHCNWHLKKDKTQKTKMKNLLGHVAESLLICGVKRKGGHHHMFETIGTHTNEDH
jgi:hypothetical protein